MGRRGLMWDSVGRRGTDLQRLTSGEVVPKLLSETVYAGLRPINFGTQPLNLQHGHLRHRNRLNWCPNISTPNQIHTTSTASTATYTTGLCQSSRSSLLYFCSSLNQLKQETKTKNFLVF